MIKLDKITKHDFLSPEWIQKYKDDPNAVLIAGPYQSKGEATQALGQKENLDKIREELL